MEKKQKTLRLALLGLFTAIELIMAFTPIGYIHITVGLEPTLMFIPVAIGAVLLGPAAGAFLGGVFGVTSFIQCFGMSPFGAALLQISPAATFITCMVPRILEGFLTGLIFKGLSKTRIPRVVSMGVGNLMCPVLNTVMFMTCIVVFFFNSGYIQEMISSNGVTNNIFAFVVWMVGLQGVLEAVICLAVGTAVSKALDVAMGRLVPRGS